MDTSSKDILISGASVAGPALAYWLSRRGFRPTVVERAPRLRGGGYAVDFRGRVHLDVLTKMGLLDQIRDRQTHLRSITYVDTDGRPVARMPAEIFAGDVEILRGDLGQILYEATRDDTEYIFGDSITGIEQDSEGVRVSFEHAAPRSFGLVIGADGLHSNVRRQVFGEEAGFVSDLGYYVSIFTVPDTFGLDHSGLLYSVPGRTASVFSAGEQAIAQFYFAAADATGEPQEVLASAFAGVGWVVPELLAAMKDAPDFYFDSVSQVHLDRWSSGRVSLIGDAAAAAGPGGNGTGNAVVAAYVLAGELAAAGGDYRAAFERYERLLRPYVAKGQKQAQGGSAVLAPPTQKKIQQRDRMFRMLPYTPARPLIKYLSTRTATGITLPSYALYTRAGDDHRLLVVPAALPVPHVTVVLTGAQPLGRDRRPLGRRRPGGGVAEVRDPADAQHGHQADDRDRPPG
jgi:2-polyprenyl-6-methoxyphenol hydroxylase-like FAD-dependent oxidoreductase